MEKRENAIIFATLMLNVVYILLVDTTSLHGLAIPAIEIMAIIMLIPIIYLGYIAMKPTENTSKRLLYFTIILSIVATIMRLFRFFTRSEVYPILLLVNAIVFIVAIAMQKSEFSYGYMASYSLATIIYFLNIFELNEFNIIIGPIFELAILVAIIVFIYLSKPEKLEVAILGVLAIIGFLVGLLIAAQDVAPLIIKTVFQQILNVSQYSFGFVETKHFFALHFAEIFAVIGLIVMKKKSLPTMAIIAAGFDLTFPPLAALRSLAFLNFLKEE